MTPYEVYVCFLCLKQHFTKENYDVFKYNWKTRASLASYNKRTDRYFFEKLSRKYTDSEIKDFFVSNFVYNENSNGVYISDLVKEGEQVYNNYKKNTQSLFYNFKTEVEVFFSHQNLNLVLSCNRTQHPLLIQKYLQKCVSIETLVIFNFIFDYINTYDKILDDPIWKAISLKLKKYSPFIQINKQKYIEVMKEIFCE